MSLAGFCFGGKNCRNRSPGRQPVLAFVVGSNLLGPVPSVGLSGAGSLFFSSTTGLLSPASVDLAMDGGSGCATASVETLLLTSEFG